MNYFEKKFVKFRSKVKTIEKLVTLIRIISGILRNTLSRFQLRHPPQPQHTVACFGSARTRERYAGLHSLLLSPLREFTSYRSASWSCTWYMELVGNWIWVSYLFWLLHGIKLAAWKNLLFRFSQVVLWFIKYVLQGLFFVIPAKLISVAINYVEVKLLAHILLNINKKKHNFQGRTFYK